MSTQSSKNLSNKGRKEWKCPAHDGKACAKNSLYNSEMCATHKWYSENYINEAIIYNMTTSENEDTPIFDSNVIRQVVKIMNDLEEYKSDNALNSLNSYIIYKAINWTDILHNLDDKELCESILEYVKKGKIKIDFHCNIVEGCTNEEYPKWKIELLEPYIKIEY